MLVLWVFSFSHCALHPGAAPPSLLEPCLAHSTLFVLERKRLPFLQADVATQLGELNVARERLPFPQASLPTPAPLPTAPTPQPGRARMAVPSEWVTFRLLQ